MDGSVIKTHIDPKSPAFQANSRQMIDRLTEIKNEESRIREGGGAKAIEAQHKKNRLTARERIALLIDPKSEFFELGLYAAHEMYKEWGGAPAAGTIAGLGRVAGRLVMIVANDATVKAGAFFPDDRQKSDPCAKYRHGKPHSGFVSRRFLRHFSTVCRKTYSRTRTTSAGSSVTTP